MSLEGKVVIVTGASSGIGAATAIHFAELGAKVVLNGRNESNLKEVAGKCPNQDQNLLVLGDVTIEEDCKKIVNETVARYGKIDILVNNAGILESGDIETCTTQQFDRILNTNTRAVFILTQLAVPHLVATKGNIVNVSSVAGSRSFPGIVAYGTSKAAVDQLTKCVALELAAKGVSVNSVNPGVIITEVHKRGGMDDESYKAFLKKSESTHALGRPGNAREVATAIAFLASDNASYITGELLHVDGGRHAMCPR